MGRLHWKSRTAFLLAAIGSAVGLGNVWRFPYMTAKFGGGAFLIPYLLALFIIGIPLLLLEFSLGQKLQHGAIKTFASLKRGWGALGIFALTSGFLVIAYYGVVMAWSLIYLISSWGVHWKEDSSGFFFGEVLQISDGVGSLGGVNINILLALLVIWVLIYFSIWKGIRSVGAVVWFTVPLPIILLAVLFVRGITLPGFMDGWLFYLQPDWSLLLSAEVWIAAISQIFFTLTLAFGVMIAYASYNNKKENVVKDTWITALTNSAISLFAGFVVFAIVGYMATAQGASVADVAGTGGPGFAFVIFPAALSLMPFAWFFSMLFFITLLTLGVDSAFSIVEAINAGIQDTKWGSKLSSERLSLWVCIILFLAGIIFTTHAGLYILDIVDHFVTNYNIVMSGFLACVLVGWIYGPGKVRKYINSVSPVKIGKWWEHSIKYIIPLALVVLFTWQLVIDIQSPYENYPQWALMIGWGCFVIPFILFTILLTRKKSLYT